MLSPPGRVGPGHRSLQVTGTCCLAAPLLRSHGGSCAQGTTGGDLTAIWHRWCCLAGWVSHSHGEGLMPLHVLFGELCLMLRVCMCW